MNIAGMMKQVQEMQSKMTDMQSRLGEMEFIGQSGAGAVVATMNGKFELKKIKLDPKLVDPAEIEMLEDLIVAACSDAKAKAETYSASESEKLMGGLKLPPGVKLPF
ncbi:MAG TPA: YbaB/EbfC family nucleoid-associated protein [Alphaproteobacteria bacterium]|nr:YbaB/EbfC family nucleoid-associated protein [Alphaproteobacteria bacterium]